MMAVTRLSGGLSPADGSDPRTFPLIFNEAADVIDANEADITAVEGRVTTAEADITELETVGFRFVGTRYYTSDGTFAKADPFGNSSFDGAKLRAIRVRVQGAGGGGAGAGSTGAGEVTVNGHGAGGAFCESFITNIAGLAATVDVTRGGGGAGGVGASGSAGGSSSFGSLVVAGGGGAGPLLGNAPVPLVGQGTAGGSATTGDLKVTGQNSDAPIYVALNLGGSNTAANSFLGRGGQTARTADGVNGAGGSQGGGGSAAAQTQSQASTRTGGTGGNGIVIVDVFA